MLGVIDESNQKKRIEHDDELGERKFILRPNLRSVTSGDRRDDLPVASHCICRKMTAESRERHDQGTLTEQGAGLENRIAAHLGSIAQDGTKLFQAGLKIRIAGPDYNGLLIQPQI